MKTLRLDDEHLFAVISTVIARGGHLAVRVHGESMRPAVSAGDVLVLGPSTRSEPRPRQLVVVRRRAKLIAHRVATVSGAQQVTQGDSRESDDGETARDAVVAMVRGVRSRSLAWRGVWHVWQWLKP